MLNDLQDVRQLYEHIYQCSDIKVEQLSLNPVVLNEGEAAAPQEDWVGIMYLYMTPFENPTRLQIISTVVDQLDIFPIDGEVMMNVPVETEFNFYSVWLSRYNKHHDPHVGTQVSALAQVLFLEGYEVRCHEWSAVAEHMGLDLSDVPLLGFPLFIFTHPESKIKVIVNCEPIILQ